MYADICGSTRGRCSIRVREVSIDACKVLKTMTTVGIMGLNSVDFGKNCRIWLVSTGGPSGQPTRFLREKRTADSGANGGRKLKRASERHTRTPYTWVFLSFSPATRCRGGP